jgi:hypothetical protein
MRFSHDHQNGNRAAVLMATCLIVLMGAIGCAAIALAGDPERPLSTLIQAGAVFIAIVFLLWILRDRPAENHSKILWSWLGRRRKRKIAFRAQARLPAEQRAAAAPAPPTAEAIRELAGGTSTWVPSTNAPPRRQGDAKQVPLTQR